MGKILSAEPGQIFNRWTLIERVDREGGGFWRARCACENVGIVKLAHLVNGQSKSCGCLKNELTRARMTTHGQSRGPDGKMTPEWATWSRMKSRCFNENVERYKRYGGRGIKICDRWLGPDGFIHFLADMGKRPAGEYSIERKNNDGDYDPDNCIWLLLPKQARNRSNNYPITYKGETLLACDWAQKTGMPADVIIRRIEQLGWSIDRAMTEPRRLEGKERKKQFVTFNGRTLSIQEWSRETGISVSALRKRLLYYKWTIERALTTP